MASTSLVHTSFLPSARVLRSAPTASRGTAARRMMVRADAVKREDKVEIKGPERLANPNNVDKKSDKPDETNRETDNREQVGDVLYRQGMAEQSLPIGDSPEERSKVGPAAWQPGPFTEHGKPRPEDDPTISRSARWPGDLADQTSGPQVSEQEGGQETLDNQK